MIVCVMRHLGLVLVLLLAGSQALAFSPKVEIVERFDDFQVMAFIDAQDIQENPAWQPGDGDPPLSVAGAISAVGGLQDGTIAVRDIREIELRLMPRHDNSWHYLVRVANGAMISENEIFVVLMSGKVIPAIIRPGN